MQVFGWVTTRNSAGKEERIFQKKPQGNWQKKLNESVKKLKDLKKN